MPPRARDVGVSPLAVERLFLAPANSTAAEMTSIGVRVDRPALEQLGRDAREHARRLEADLAREAGRDGVNWGSADQICALLYDDLRLPPPPIRGGKKATKPVGSLAEDWPAESEHLRALRAAGVPLPKAWRAVWAASQVEAAYRPARSEYFPSDFKALGCHAKAVPWLGTLLQLRDALKVLGGFVVPMLAQSAASGRVHCVMTHSAKSGRVRHSKPNLAQLPSSDDSLGLAKRLKRCILADPGMRWVAADMPSLEWRIMSELALRHGDPDMLREIVDGLDPHCGTAVGLLGLPEAVRRMSGDEAKAAGHKKARDQAKTLNYCLSPDTVVLRADGARVPARQVTVGDELMGPDSRPRRVVQTFTGRAPMYRVALKKSNASWTVTGAHKWPVAVMGKKGPSTILATTEELHRANKSAAEKLRLRHVPVEFPARPAPAIDPYIYGIWLADGTKNCATFTVTKPDPEIGEALAAWAGSEGFSYSSSIGNAGCPVHHISTRAEGQRSSPFLSRLREYWAERVPPEIALGSMQTRLEFLAGFLDGDGTLVDNGVAYVFSQARADVSAAVASVAWSCGLAVREWVNSAGSSCVRIFGDTEKIPCRVERKKAHGMRKCAAGLLGFTVEPIGEADFCGWEVDRDHLFLLAEGVVTHNSIGYGASELSIAASLGISREEARDLLERFLVSGRPGLGRAIAAAHDEMREQGWTDTMIFGRRRFAEGGPRAWPKKKNLRTAFSHRVSGTATDIVTAARLHLWSGRTEQMAAAGWEGSPVMAALGARMHVEIHDACYFQVPAGSEAPAAAEIERVMGDPLQGLEAEWAVPLGPVKAEVGDTLGDV